MLPAAFHRLSQDEVEARLRASTELATVSKPHVDWLLSVLPRGRRAVFLCDADAVIVESVGDDSELLRSSGLLTGFDWSARRMGASGVGTVVAEGRPLTVRGGDHGCPAWHGCVSSGVPLHGPGGNIVGALGFLSVGGEAPPTAFELVSHAARMIEKELAYRHAIRSTESLKLLARISSFMAHELVNPLTGVATAMELLSRRITDVEGTRVLDRCRQQITQMKTLADDLRLLGGASHSVVEPVDLGALVDEVLRSLALPQGIRTLVETMQRPRVYGNKRLLGQAVANLVVNAMQMMPGGGTIGVRAEPRGHMTRLTVWDDGPGVPLEHRDNLFREPFTTKERGSGLGLLLVRAIVEQVHSGVLSFSANDPHGSSFHIDLPQVPVSGAPPAA